MLDEHIKSAANGGMSLIDVRAEALVNDLRRRRDVLGNAAKGKKSGWFKSISWMEEAAKEIIGPDLVGAESGFALIIESIFAWACSAGN